MADTPASATGAATPSSSREPVRVGDAAQRWVDRINSIRARGSERPRQQRPPSDSIRDWSTGNNQKLLQVLLSRAGVPVQYQGAEWPRCRARDVLEPWSDRLRNHAAAGRGLILTGPVGTGKSSTAGIIARRAIEIGLSVRWEYVATLLDDLEDRGSRKSAFARQAHIDVLVLDDFGVADIKQWQIPHVDRIVEHRYSRRLSTIVTANIPLSSMAMDPALARFVDRWRERMTGVELVGDSMRKRPSE